MSMSKVECHPQRIFTSSDYAVVLLNRPILIDTTFFTKIWKNAAVRHVIDGGANQFFDFLDKQPENVKGTLQYPDIASGDFDSITELSMKRLKDETMSQCKIVETEDQNETDFTKGLRVLYDELKSSEHFGKVKNVIIICEFNGRLDQILGNLNTLHKNVFAEDPDPDKPTVFLMSAETLCWLLPANHENIITFEKDVPNFTCGVVPLQGATNFSTSGLQWDMTPDMVCQFGGLISTSNNVVARMLHITPQNHHAIFSLEINTTDYVLDNEVAK